ncbi:MAG: NAD(P)/FAD-dependent oxidoreductase [Pyrinomonadaceae bacterium]
MRSADVVIVGGGVVGASVAYHLTERGVRDVLILEREAGQGSGSTGKATGGVRAQFETDINIRLSLYSIDFFREWDHDCGYEPRGYLFFATTDEQFAYIERNVRRLRELGVRGVETIDRDAVHEIVPGMIVDDIVGGSFGASDGFIDPLAVMRGFTDGALARGASIRFDSEVRSINVAAGRVRSVSTAEGEIECGAAVVCAGAWARPLAATAGIDLPVEPMRRQIVWARSSTPLPPKLPMVIDLGSGFHFRPAKDSDREALFAYPDPDERASTDTEFDESFIAKVYKRARLRAPFLAETEVVRERCRAGLYENSPDHHAILGGCEVAGLYFADGFSGHGVMHSPATGRALSEIIVDGRSSFLDVSCLGIDRFARGELLHETAFI